MRVMLLTPGTGHFYCGSCLRDDTLGQALQRLGHEVVSVPLYLPHQLEREQAEQPVHMGGINVYLQQKSRLARFLPRFVANWFDRPSLLRWASRRGNMTDAKALDVPILVTLQGETPFLDELHAVDAEAAWQALRERSAEADALIAVSETYGREMRERLGVAADKLHVVHNGIDVADFAEVDASQRRPKTIGYLARMCRDKGLDTLVDAFLILKQRGTIDGLRLRVAGVQLPEDRAYVRKLLQRIAEQGAADDVEFLPNIDRAAKVAFLQTLSVMSVPARYQESFGLYLLEAMAASVPVVQPRHAAFPEILEATQGGVLCEPNSPEALADALASVLRDDELAQTLGRQGRESVARQFTAEHMAKKVASICDLVTGRKRQAVP